MLAGDPSAFGFIYILYFFCYFTYFICKVSRNTSYSCGNTNPDLVNIVGGFNFKGDSFASQEDLHALMKTKDKVEGWHLLNIVIRKGPAVLKLLACRNQTLLVRWNILDLHWH